MVVVSLRVATRVQKSWQTSCTCCLTRSHRRLAVTLYRQSRTFASVSEHRASHLLHRWRTKQRRQQLLPTHTPSGVKLVADPLRSLVQRTRSTGVQTCAKTEAT